MTQSKIEKDFLKNGYVIQKVENLKSLIFISDFIYKKSVELIKLKKTEKKKFNFNTLHHYLSNKKLNNFRLELIKSINNEKIFRKNYFKLAKNSIFSIVGNELAMQNNINISIQFPKDDSSLLPIHSDTWDGNSPFETVLWLPLVNCYKTKSMYILNFKKYQKFEKIFEKPKLSSVSHLYKLLKSDLEFLNIKKGEYLIFNQNLPHGNIVNKTKETRISLNCRFKGLFTPYRHKKLGAFFSPLTLRPASRIGIKYKFPGDK